MSSFGKRVKFVMQPTGNLHTQDRFMLRACGWLAVRAILSWWWVVGAFVNYPHKGDQKLVKTVRSSTQDWSSFQLAITTHQQSFTHNGIARGAKIGSKRKGGRFLYTSASETYTVCSAPNGLLWRKHATLLLCCILIFEPEGTQRVVVVVVVFTL